MCNCDYGQAVAAARAALANAATALRHADVRAVELQAENEVLRIENRVLADKVRRLEAERLEPVARLRHHDACRSPVVVRGHWKNWEKGWPGAGKGGVG